MKTKVLSLGALVWILLCPVSVAHADTALELDEPKTLEQPTKYRLQVLDDGFAYLHLKWSSPSDTKRAVDLSLSAFKAEGQQELAIVGFDSGKPDGPFLPSLQGVEVPANGPTALRLAASGLTSGVDYVGKFYATVGKRQTLIWTIILFRPSAVAPFRCPTGPQIVNPDGSTAIDFERTAPLNEKLIGLRLSAFISREQERGQVGFLDRLPSRELLCELQSYPLEGRHFMPPIRTAGLTEGVTYTGRVWFVVGARDVMVCSLDLLLPKLPRGELVSDSQSLTQRVMLPFLGLSFLGGNPNPTLAMRLFEKTRTRRIDGITATLDGVTESPEGAFDLNRHVSFWVNGTQVPDFTQLQLPMTDVKSRAARTLQPGEQLNVEMKLRDLSAGKYAFALRFSGVNAASVTPKLDVTINVRHDWLWAVLAVLAATTLSFFITKGIVNWRERIRVLDRVQQMREDRFDEHADLPSVVFLHAVLDQTDELLKHKWLLPPSPSVYDHLARAERVVTILRRYSLLRKALDEALCLDSVKLHYREAIAEVMHRLGPQPLDQKTTDGIVEDLGVIAARLVDPMIWYRSTLKNKANLLAQEARDVQAALGDPDVVNRLLTTLENPPPDPNSDFREFDHAYWFVKLLYSRRMFQEEVKELVRTFERSGHNLDETFKVGDRLAWERLKNAVNNGHVQVKPVDSVEDQEALHPMKFRLNFDDRALAESYLVLNVLTYEWHFNLVESPQPPSWPFRLRAKRPTPPVTNAMPPRELKPVTVNEPRVTQYAPAAGQLEVSAVIRWQGADGVQGVPVDPRLLVKIGENTEPSLLRNLDRSEFLLGGIVTAIALVTSLPILYFSKATFGSFGDYAAILAWAVGVDQGKNLIQLLKAFPADSAPAASSP